MVYGTSGIWMWSTLPGLDRRTEKLWGRSSVLNNTPSTSLIPCLLLWAHIILSFLLRLRKPRVLIYTPFSCAFSQGGQLPDFHSKTALSSSVLLKTCFSFRCPGQLCHIIRTGVKWVGALDLFLSTERLNLQCSKISLFEVLLSASWPGSCFHTSNYENITVLFCLLSSVWRPLFHLILPAFLFISF